SPLSCFTISSLSILSFVVFFSFMLPRPPPSTLFPYTTLFRSIPAGTTNDFARALHIPRDPLKALDIILNGQTMYLDVGYVNDEYFINIAGGGDLTELTYDVPIKLKTILGYFAYFVRGIEKLPSMKPVRTKI